MKTAKNIVQASERLTKVEQAGPAPTMKINLGVDSKKLVDELDNLPGALEISIDAALQESDDDAKVAKKLLKSMLELKRIVDETCVDLKNY